MHHFASQLRREQDPTPSLRAAHYRHKRRARRNHDAQHQDDDDDDDNNNNDDDDHEHNHDHQDSPVPAPPFPHAPASPPRAYHGSAKAYAAMAQLPSPLYALHAEPAEPATAEQDASAALKKTHLHVLSAIMHKSLLDADYPRAARAWALLLRTHLTGGQPVDPRNHGRWGIGAELLLHTRGHGDFTRDGFQRAKDYYERLIVQYPHRRIQPTATDERTFYPALLSLYILDVCQQSTQARASVHDQAAQHARTSRSPSSDSVLGPAANDVDAKEEALRVEELARAMEIAERLDHLVASPPFDKQVSLLLLRGHVGLWLSDLIIGQTSSDEDWDMDTSLEDSGHQSFVSSDQRTRLANGQRELHQAQRLFERAESAGAQGLAATMASIHIRRKELARRCDQPSGLGYDVNSQSTLHDDSLDSIQSDAE